MPTTYSAPPPSGEAGRDRVTLSGTWTVRGERIDAGPDSSLVLDYSAAKVLLVLGGQGTARVTQGGSTQRVEVSGAPTLYELRQVPPSARIEVALDEGMSAYAFTVG